MNKKIFGLSIFMAISNYANSDIVETKPIEIKEDLQQEN